MAITFAVGVLVATGASAAAAAQPELSTGTVQDTYGTDQVSNQDSYGTNGVSKQD